MAASVIKRITKASVPGSGRRSVTEVTLTNSYPEGGLLVSPKELGLQRVSDAFCVVKNGSEAEATAVGSVWYDKATGKIKVNDYKTQKEMVKEKDLSKVVVLVMAQGS